MNRLFIIGNVVRNPESRTTTTGKRVCSFTVAVNRRGDQEADYFRVSAWESLGDICAKYLSKGRKVAVVGSVNLHTYDSNGKTGASMEVYASEVEFLSAKEKTEGQPIPVEPEDNPFTEKDDLPF